MTDRPDKTHLTDFMSKIATNNRTTAAHNTIAAQKPPDFGRVRTAKR